MEINPVKENHGNTTQRLDCLTLTLFEIYAIPPILKKKKKSEKGLIFRKAQLQLFGDLILTCYKENDRSSLDREGIKTKSAVKSLHVTDVTSYIPQLIKQATLYNFIIYKR